MQKPGVPGHSCMETDDTEDDHHHHDSQHLLGPYCVSQTVTRALHASFHLLFTVSPRGQMVLASFYVSGNRVVEKLFDPAFTERI